MAPQPDSGDELSPDALIVALRTTFDAAAMENLRGTVTLRLPGDALLPTVGKGRLDAVRGDAPAHAASAEGDLRLLRRFLFAFDDHREPPADAGRAF